MSKDSKRILVVDDAATVRMYHKHVLESAGFKVEEAINGIEALEKSLLNTFDLYLVDINMPKLDGYDFLKDLRSRDLPQAPAIMISTEAEDNDKVRAYEAGANFYLLKPLKSEELLKYSFMLLGLGNPA